METLWRGWPTPQVSIRTVGTRGSSLTNRSEVRAYIHTVHTYQAFRSGPSSARRPPPSWLIDWSSDGLVCSGVPSECQKRQYVYLLTQDTRILPR